MKIAPGKASFAMLAAALIVVGGQASASTSLAVSELEQSPTCKLRR